MEVLPFTFDSTWESLFWSGRAFSSDVRSAGDGACSGLVGGEDLRRSCRMIEELPLTFDLTWGSLFWSGRAFPPVTPELLNSCDSSPYVPV